MPSTPTIAAHGGIKRIRTMKRGGTTFLVYVMNDGSTVVVKKGE